MNLTDSTRKRYPTFWRKPLNSRKSTISMSRCILFIILMVSLRWESAQYYIGQFHDDCFKALSDGDKISRYINAVSRPIFPLFDGWIIED